MRKMATLAGPLAALAVGLAAAAGAQPKARHPMNVVFILADDLGWADTTLYGHTRFHETPNLERLAARGMVFNRAYAASPLCSPTRASILTGQTPARNGSTAPQHHLAKVLLQAELKKSAPAGSKALETESATRLDTRLPTLGKLVKSKGYATAHFGKWHLGPTPYSPLEHGFDIDIPHWPGPGPAGSFVAPWKYPDFKENKPKEHIEDRMAGEAVAWLRRRNPGKPFFMNYWQFSVHAPFDAKQELIDHYAGRIDRGDAQHSPTYAAMVRSLDDAVGALLDEIDRQGIADRTIVIFFSDNGGNMYNGIEEVDAQGERFVAEPTSNRPLRGGKATLYEGGIRVPMVVAWPGVARPGSRSDAIVQSTDFYPTLLNALGVPLPDGWTLDGRDFLPALRGEPFDRGPTITFFPHSPGVPDWLPPSVSAMVGDWKLIRLFHQGDGGAHAYRLYHLGDDLGERNDLAARHPERVEALDRLIQAHLDDARAVVPLPNPGFDPAKYRPEEVGVQKGGLKIGKRPHAGGDAGAPAAKARGGRSAGGWSAGRESVGLRIEDGALIVGSVAADPWIESYFERPLQGRSPLTLRFEVWTDGPGAMRVYDRAQAGRGFAPATKVDVEVPASGRWVEAGAKLASGSPLHALRINTPNRHGETRLRNIRLLDASGKVLRQWFQEGER